MKTSKLKAFGSGVLDVLLYILMFISLILSSFILAIFLVKYINKKRQQSQIRKLAVRKTHLENQRIAYVNKLSKYELALQKHQDNEKKCGKIKKKITKMNIRIDNLDKILSSSNEPKVEVVSSPMVEKFENRINDIQSTLKGH